MVRKNIFKKLASITLSVTMLSTLVLPNVNIDMFTKTAMADNLPVTYLGSGSIGNGSNETDAAKLPRTSTQGTYRFTTNNYNSNHQALDTNDWASSWLWDLQGDRPNGSSDANNELSGTAYAFPLSFLMKTDGLRITKPSMTSSPTNISAYNIKDNDTLCDFNFYPSWTCDSSNIDEITDWSYEAIATNPSDRTQYMKTTMTQGSPFAYIELNNSNVMYIEKLRVTFPSDIILEETYSGCKMIVFRTNDITSSVNGYPGLTYQYYALFLPEGATVEHLGTTDTTNNDRIGKLKITLPSDRRYLSFAWVDESTSHEDSVAISYAKEYRPYAFNFITDTRADYSYNESTGTLTTTYKYSFSKKAESTADGTVMGILPHQYKNMSGYSYMSNNAVTLRGIMKFMKGSSYETKMTYKGILPYMPELSDDDTVGKTQLQSYVNDFMNTYMSGSGNWTLSNDQGNETYYHGKKLNRAAQVIAAANAVGDDTSARRVLNGLEANLEEWFTYSGPNDGNYFTYLGEGVGVLLGFPTSFNAVDQFNDHHFHYGYFIQSAACVGLWDKEWLNEYKDVVKQLIYDIACPYRDDAACVADCGNAYPYLRSFSPYEGHSWASGYEDERTGNNQESTSEAINAWAGIILFGELTGDTKIRDLGIYLYTTEIEAADNYWFDIDEDIYNIENSKYEPPMASMVWGGKVDYATWFGAEYTQGIQICPMQSWSFYYLNGGDNISGQDYIKKYYNYDKTSSLAGGGSTGLWNDMWAAYYALADPETAMNSVWTKNTINDGESQAHTYHYIQSLIDYGTPNLNFTSDNTLSSVFEKNGEYTYATYNSSNVTKTVTFTDASGNSVQVKAAPNAMTLFNSKDIGKPSYTVEYYAKDLNSSNYTLINTSIEYAYAGESVTANQKEFVGYSFDYNNVNNKLTGTVSTDNSLVLKVYYSRNTYTVSYQMNGGSVVNSSLYPYSYTYGQTYSLDSPIRDGYDFYGWYTENTFDNKLESINERTNGNLTLYAKWIPAGTILINEDVYLTFDEHTNGIFTIVGDLGYDAVNVLYKIVDTASEAKSLADSKAEEGFVAWGLDRNSTGWTRTENFSASKGKYIVFYFIRYDSNGGYKTDYGYGGIATGSTGNNEPVVTTTQQPTSQQSTSQQPATEVPTTSEISSDVEKPVVPFGINCLSNSEGTFTIVMGNPLNGQTYNIYVDGVYLKNVSLGEHIISNITPGVHTVTLTGVLNGMESEGADVQVTVMGAVPETEAPTTEAPTTEAPTTEAPTTEAPTTSVPSTYTAAKVEINGYQISTVEEGFRTVYSVYDPDNEIVSAGMLYGIGTVTESDMTLETKGNTVYDFVASDSGKMEVSFSQYESAQSYSMTMKFAKSVTFYTTNMSVRAYAKLSDGTYIYSDIKSYTVYRLANYLYQNLLMNSLDAHEYLYNNILSVVNSSYKVKDFAWNNSIVKPDDIEVK